MELKPCPFCGGEAFLRRGNVHLKMFALLDVNGLKLGDNKACLLKAMMIYQNNASIACT